MNVIRILRALLGEVYHFTANKIERTRGRRTPVLLVASVCRRHPGGHQRRDGEQYSAPGDRIDKSCQYGDKKLNAPPAAAGDHKQIIKLSIGSACSSSGARRGRRQRRRYLLLRNGQLPGFAGGSNQLLQFNAIHRRRVKVDLRILSAGQRKRAMHMRAMLEPGRTLRSQSRSLPASRQSCCLIAGLADENTVTFCVIVINASLIPGWRYPFDQRRHDMFTVAGRRSNACGRNSCAAQRVFGSCTENIHIKPVSMTGVSAIKAASAGIPMSPYPRTISEAPMLRLLITAG